MASNVTTVKRTAGDVLREVGDVGRAHLADKFAINALTEAIARKQKAEARLAELGRASVLPMEKLIKQAG